MKMITNMLSSMMGGDNTPAASTEAQEDVTEDEKKSKKARTALYATEGGVAGEEVVGISTQGRSTLFGN